MCMEIHQLRYFVSIVETGSFSKAAKRCYVAQPSLSQQIIKLEKELGAKLFDRLGGKVVLTDAGTALLPRAKRIIQDTAEVKARFAEDISASSGSLAVGFITTIAPYIMPEALRKFKSSYPDSDIKVYENLTENLVEMLINFEIDIAIMSLPVESELLTYNILFYDPLVLSVPKSYELAKRKNIRLENLKDVPYIELDEQHCLGEQIQNICYEKHLSTNTVCKTWNISTILNCVSLGTGISIVPLMTAATNKSEHYVYKKLKDSPRRAVVSAYYEKRTKKKLAAEFEKIITEQYTSLVKNSPLI